MTPQVMGRVAFLFCFLLPVGALAKLTISNIQDHRSVLVSYTTERLEKGEVLPVLSRHSSRVVGFVVIKGTPRRGVAQAEIITHSKSALIVVGDTLKQVDYGDVDRRPQEFTGRTDLLLKGKKKYAAQYKHLVYQGFVIGQTASTLDAGENLLDVLGFYAHGVTDRLQFSTFGFLNFQEDFNVGLKYQLVNNETLMLSPGIDVYHRTRDPMRTLYHFHLYIDGKTNSKFMTHNHLSIRSESFREEDADSIQSGFLVTSSLTSGYSYTFDNWDRLLMGPKYNFEKKAIGGYVGYMMVWNHLHLSVNVQTANIAEFSFGEKGYVPYLYLFWRF